jgi:glutathione peroxidase
MKELNLFKVVNKLFLFSVILFSTTFCQTDQTETKGDAMNNSINDISVVDMSGKTIPLSDYKGDVLLIVNVASECGNTPQYEGLEKIYEKYKDKGFEILAFPCNQFGGQEPGTNEEIKQFCTTNYDVKFKLFDKIEVNGKNQIPLYAKLTNNSVTGKKDIPWNFEKFLISRNGDIVQRFNDKVKPTTNEVISAIEGELAKK